MVLSPLRCFVMLAALVGLSSARADDPNHAAVKPVPREGGWMNRHNSFVERARKGDVDVLFLGDSITEGWAGGGREAWKEKFAPLKAANFGIGGDRTEHVLWRITEGKELEGIKPKAAVIMIGTNNMGANSAVEIADGVTAIVKKLRAQRPDTKILLLGIFPRGEKAADPVRAKIKDTNTRIAKLDDGKNVKYLDIGTKFLNADGDLTKEVMPDYLHLSPKGYTIWADAVEPSVKDLLRDEPKHAAVTPANRPQENWMKRHNAFVDRAKKGDVDVLFLGDSITQGWEGNGKDVWKEKFAPLKAANFGIGGDRTEHVLWRITEGKELEGIKPKAAVIMIGTNNMGSNSAEEIADGVTAIVGQLRSQRPDTKILLLGIFPRGEKASDKFRDKIKDTNTRIAKLDDGKNVKYLDIGAKFLTAEGDLSREIMPDYLHLSPKGYTIWADAVEPSVKDLLK